MHRNDPPKKVQFKNIQIFTQKYSFFWKLPKILKFKILNPQKHKYKNITAPLVWCALEQDHLFSD